MARLKKSKKPSRVLSDNPPTGDLITDKASCAYWWLSIDCDNDDIPYRTHRKMSYAMQDLFRYVYRCCFYNALTGQYVFGFGVPKNQSIDSVLEEVNIILPYVIKQDDFREIIIREYTEARDGMYSIRVCDNEIRLVMKAYGVDRATVVFGKLYDALRYIQENHWYDEYFDVTIERGAFI